MQVRDKNECDARYVVVCQDIAVLPVAERVVSTRRVRTGRKPITSKKKQSLEFVILLKNEGGFVAA